jgi:hypothetical protein
MAEILDFTPRNRPGRDENRAADQAERQAERNGRRITAIKTMIMDRPLASTQDAKRLAMNLYEILTDVEKNHGVPKRTIAKRAVFRSGKTWKQEVSDSTKRLHPYILPPNVANEGADHPRVKKLAKTIDKYQSLAAQAATEIGKPEDHFLMALVRGTRYDNPTAPPDEDHLYELAETIERMIAWIVRKAKLDDYFRDIYALPMAYDVRRDQFFPRSVCGMELNDDFDGVDVCSDEVPPMPSVPLYRKERHPPVAGHLFVVSQTHTTPMGLFYSPTKRIPSDMQDSQYSAFGNDPMGKRYERALSLPPENEVIAVYETTIRTWQEVRLTIGPIAAQQKLGPLFEVRLGMEPIVDDFTFTWLNPYGDDVDAHYLMHNGELHEAFLRYLGDIPPGDEAHPENCYFYYEAVKPSTIKKYLDLPHSGQALTLEFPRGGSSFDGPLNPPAFPASTVGAELELNLLQPDEYENFRVDTLLLREALHKCELLNALKEEISTARESSRARLLARWGESGDSES